jgi:hypothetical protein
MTNAAALVPEAAGEVAVAGLASEPGRPLAALAAGRASVEMSIRKR